MKKLICFGLTLMMLMAAFSAYADSEMDAVFDSGSPTLSEVTGEFDGTPGRFPVPLFEP